MNRFVRGALRRVSLRAGWSRALVIGVAVAIPVVIGSWQTTGRAEDWPTFRGPGRTAVSGDTGLLQVWPAEGPKLVWETQGGGRGYSSLAIAGQQIYTLGDGPSTAEDKDEYLVCFNRESGTPVWKAKTGPAWNMGQANWQGSRGNSPTVDGDRVYVISSSRRARLPCDTSTGQQRPAQKLEGRFPGQEGRHLGVRRVAPGRRRPAGLHARRRGDDDDRSQQADG